ncbi:MAG: TonB C-terminal domain-containing protein [Proteobacteria bacterium]|nr:TonB C-terminal domain-containing protein [Pseudomonadota bacterium]
MKIYKISILLIPLTILWGCAKPPLVIVDSSSFSKYCTQKANPGSDLDPELLDKYHKMAYTHISSNWALPEKKWDKTLVTTVVIQTLYDGTIEKIYVEKKSGNNEFDSFALKAIRESNPLPKYSNTEDTECLLFGLKFYP